jgi:FkbM family methyltransferase
MKILVYAGLNTGVSFGRIYRQFDYCYGFEAQPNLAEQLNKKYSNTNNVKIINAAVCEDNNPKPFYITDNTHGQSSSLGKISTPFNQHRGAASINVSCEIEVPGLYLPDYLRDNNISEIHTYISDIQGYDFTVLKTLDDYIQHKKIKNIQIECDCDYFKHNSYDLEHSNKESEIINYLSNNYTLVKKQDGNYNPNSTTRWVHRDLYFEAKI